jgi:large subunit ribosomal protein L20
MSRVRRGFKARRRRKKVFKLAKGFHFDRRTTFRQTVQTVVRALHYQFISRRLFKRDMRGLWITRINGASNQLGISYSKLIHSLKLNKITINRKMLSELAAKDPKGFAAVVSAVR